ncbi:DNA polymerase Y family protein [Nocardia sp. CC227C]|uniref:DNA polymerase Y family protein n=1 Tax=Nocardia sp. CC227C TaxID=3044562 RepID=UPI00278BF222|nr:DNA polymerase Y family protein [Nocardia sp. CC227C]
MAGVSGRAASRVLAVWCPDWPAVAAAAVAGVPVTRPVGVFSANRVVACTAVARAEGVRRGLRRREAQARCPELFVVQDDPDRDARAFEPVVAAVDATVPGVEVLRPGLLVSAARGAARYFGSEEAAAERLVDAVAAIGAECQIGIADELSTAVFAARRATLVPPGRGADFLAPLPVGELAVEPALSGPGRADLVDLLHRLGLRRIGDFAALAPAEVSSRFGADAIAAHRCARARPERRPGARPPAADLTVAYRCDPPIDRVDAAAFAGRMLAARLHERLAAAGVACTRLTIQAETAAGERLSRTWRCAEPLTPDSTADRIRWQLDGWLTHRAHGGDPADPPADAWSRPIGRGAQAIPHAAGRDTPAAPEQPADAVARDRFPETAGRGWPSDTAAPGQSVSGVRGRSEQHPYGTHDARSGRGAARARFASGASDAAAGRGPDAPRAGVGKSGPVDTPFGRGRDAPRAGVEKSGPVDTPFGCGPDASRTGAEDAGPVDARGRTPRAGRRGARREAAPTAPITLLRLEPVEVVSVGALQLGLWGGVGEEEARARRALARVQGLLGGEAVRVGVLSGGRGPEERITMVTLGEEPVPAADPAQPWPGRLPEPAPAVILAHRPRVRLEAADGTPVWVTDRGLFTTDPAHLHWGSRSWRLLGWAGPWPLDDRWWTHRSQHGYVARAQVLLDGDTRALLLLAYDHAWHVEGLYE